MKKGKRLQSDSQVPSVKGMILDSPHPEKRFSTGEAGEGGREGGKGGREGEREFERIRGTMDKR